MWSRARSGAYILVGTALLLGAAAACPPWTVRPIGQPASASETPRSTDDPSAYVASIWDARVVPAVIGGAVELSSVLNNRPPTANLFVKAKAVVVSVDNKSRVGVALMDLTPADGQVDAALQIGPVLRGTALRDSLEFVKFGDFVNQVAFAEVATALNERARQSALQAITPELLIGRTISFAGAVKVDDRRHERLDVLPVVLTIEDGPR
jgi:predicted lipoprotein